MIRVLIFEDNTDFIESLTELIKDSGGMEIAGVYNNCKNVLKNLDYHKPDVILMDIDMPIENGLQGLRNIRNAGNDVTIIMLTVFDDNERVFQAVCNGASGYILKRTPPEKIVEAIREAQIGGAPMTPSVAKQVLKLFSQPFQKSDDLQSLTAREQDVLSLLVRGYSYKLAASELKIGIETLRYHVKNKIRLKIQDDGIGFNGEEVKHRGGLINMQQRAEEIKSEFKMESEIGIETLRYHVKNIYTKLHVNSKSEAVAKAIQNKIS